MKWLTSKVLWINILSVVILIVNAAIQQQIIPLKYVSYAALAVTAITDIISILQAQSLKRQLASCKSQVADLSAKLPHTGSG